MNLQQRMLRRFAWGFVALPLALGTLGATPVLAGSVPESPAP